MIDSSKFVHDKSGSVAVITAIVISVFFIFSAIIINSGSLYYFKRKQQTATDLAAIAAASNIGSAVGTAGVSAASNGFNASDVARVELGRYVADASIPAGQRFSTDGMGNPNAVRVTMQKLQPYLFGSFFQANAATNGPRSSSSSEVMVTTRSVAATRNLAAFSIGSGLVSLNGGVANGVLSGLLGSNVSLSVMDYQALASTNVDIFAFSNAVATRANLRVATYNDVAQSIVALPASIAAVIDATNGSGQASAALSAILSAIIGQSGSLRLATLIDFGPYGVTSLGSAQPLTASISALGLVSAIAQAANGQHQVETALNVGLPGIASAALKVAIGEPPVGSSLIALGIEGTTLTTTQTRLRLDLQVSGPSPTSLLSVPITLNIASGSATLSSIQCTSNALTNATVQLDVTPGLVDAWVGSVPDQALSDLSTSLDPPTAWLVDVAGLVAVSGRAHASIDNTSPTLLSFGASDIAARNGKAVSETDYLVPLIGSLLGSTQLNTSMLGMSGIGMASLNTTILQSLAAKASPIDSILASTLGILGVAVGNATVWVSGVQCGRSVLVN